jgi:hypothetical protein
MSVSARWTLATFVIASLLWSSSAHATLRRFAVVVGNDHGGKGTRSLRYAEDDARRMYDILVRLGGVLPEDAQLLLGREAKDLWNALDRVERRGTEARGAGEQTALFVYFSGHAKDGDLRMGETGASLQDLKERLTKSGMDVRVAVLDACKSGVITRAKGARLAPAFEVDDGVRQGAKGLVILTSSAGDEDSQESDALQGSFFSHYLASALLGSGDTSGDGRVTLSEAYAYAYARTVAQTAGTSSGVQHPTFDYEFSGNGDLVITDTAARREGLQVPSGAPDGVYWIVDDQGAIAAEIDKRSPIDHKIALAPGAYVVTRRLPDHLRLGSFHVRSGELTVLNESSLRDAPFADDPVKGGDIDTRARLDTRTILGAGLGVESWFNQPPGLFAPAGVLTIRLDFDHAMSDHWGAGFGVGLASANSSITTDGLTHEFKYGQITTVADVFYDFLPHSEWRPYLGGRTAWMLVTRSFSDNAYPGQFYSTFLPGTMVGFRHDFSDHIVFSGELAGQYMLYTLSEPRPSSLFYVQLDLRLAWGF